MGPAFGTESTTFPPAHADPAKELRKKPSQLVNADFLIAHPALAKFFESHPALSSVLLQRSDKKQGAAKTGQQKK